MARHPPRPRPDGIERTAATRRDDALDRLRARRIHSSLQRRDGAVARLRTGTATSAGGIVVRFDEGVPSLVVGARRRDRDVYTWTLPKGTPNDGETREQTAVREVAEETGLEVRITDELESIEYWFIQRGTRIHKTVHYFLMEPIGGSLDDHDHEFDQVRWVPFSQAGSLLTFETERALVARAAEIVEPPARRTPSAVVAGPPAHAAPAAASVAPSVGGTGGAS